MNMIPTGKRSDMLRGVRQMIAHDMLTCTQRGNDALLAKLRLALPHAHIPDAPRLIPANPESVWWPLQNRWALALDDAMRAAGLAPVREDSDPDECVRQLLAQRGAEVAA